MSQNAKIYLRKNRELGASCDGCADTGHTIAEYNGLYTVWSIDDPDKHLIVGASRAEAEKAIADEWRASK